MSLSTTTKASIWAWRRFSTSFSYRWCIARAEAVGTELNPCFHRTPVQKKTAKKAVQGQPQRKEDTYRAFKEYLDVGFFSIERLKALDWSFDVDGPQVISGELTLSLKAAKLGMKMKSPRTPFVMHVPFPHLYRHRIRLPRLSALRKKIFRYE